MCFVKHYFWWIDGDSNPGLKLAKLLRSQLRHQPKFGGSCGLSPHTSIQELYRAGLYLMQGTESLNDVPYRRTILKHTKCCTFSLGVIYSNVAYRQSLTDLHNVFQYGSSFNDRGSEVGVCRLLTIYPTIRRQQRRVLNLL